MRNRSVTGGGLTDGKRQRGEAGRKIRGQRGMLLKKSQAYVDVGGVQCVFVVVNMIF